MTRYLGGRRFQPAALALMVASFAAGWNRVFTHTNGFYTAIGVIAIVVAAGFLVAWWVNRPAWMRWTFLAATFLWVFLTGTAWTIIHNIPSAASGFAWAILAAGSFWYESADYEVRSER
jgi:hypothetical protein